MEEANRFFPPKRGVAFRKAILREAGIPDSVWYQYKYQVRVVVHYYFVTRSSCFVRSCYCWRGGDDKRARFKKVCESSRGCTCTRYVDLQKIFKSLSVSPSGCMCTKRCFSPLGVAFVPIVAKLKKSMGSWRAKKKANQMHPSLFRVMRTSPPVTPNNTIIILRSISPKSFAKEVQGGLRRV